MYNLFLIVCAVWVLSEILLLILRRSKKDSQDKDLGSFMILNLTIYASIAIGVFISITRFGYINNYTAPLNLIGSAFIILGLIVRWTAIITLGRFFTVKVSIQTDHRIIQSGLYKYIRHPSYTGMLISFFGLGIGLDNWVSICIILFPILFALFNRIRIEEQALQGSFGNDYVAYCAQTWRLIPWVY